MTLTIDATPSSFTANSYVTLAEAETFFEGRANATGWDAGTNTTKNEALVHAARLVDSFRYRDFKYRTSPEQPLKFPRSNATVVSGNIDTYTNATDDIITSSEVEGEEYYPDDFFIGWACEIRSGDAIYEIKMVKDFVRSTGAITLDGSFTGTPVAGDQFRLIQKIPNEVKYAVYEVAEALLNSLLTAAIDPNVQAYSIGELSETFYGPTGEVRLPHSAMAHLRSLINRVGKMS